MLCVCGGGRGEAGECIGGGTDGLYDTEERECVCVCV